MPSFLQFLNDERVIITEGAVIERLRRKSAMMLNPHVLNSSLIYNPAEKIQLEIIYRQYIDCACWYDLPVIILTPTWRANPERISLAGLKNRDLNADCYRFLNKIRLSYDRYAGRIAIGGLMGSAGDAYKPADALPAEKACSFHSAQVRELVSAGVDFLLGSTLPAYSEALGMAQTMAESGCPYVLSFVVRPSGRLLDDTLLSDAIRNIDDAVSSPPAGYMVNCVHPENFRKAMTDHDYISAGVLRSGTRPEGRGQDLDLLKKRIIGLQANTSRRSPEELDGCEKLDSEEPETFGEMMVSLHEDFSLKILGGCCGTDEKHIDAIVRLLTLYCK